MTKETMERAAALMKTLQALNEISKELHAPLPEITAGTFGVQSCSPISNSGSESWLNTTGKVRSGL